MSELTHFNEAGEAHMVDVGDKSVTHRIAVAEGVITMSPETYAMVAAGTHKKGDVLGIARVAVDFELDQEASAIRCLCTTETRGQTGVEMEALTGVQIALLTVYDMCKAVDRAMVINQVQLNEKSGGKSSDYVRS